MGKINLGFGTKCEIAMLPLGSSTEPLKASLVTSATAIAKNTAPSTVALTGTVGAGILIPSGSFVAARSTAGYEVPLQLTADAKTGDTTLAVTSIPEAIAASSTITYPLNVSSRESFDLARKGKIVSKTFFDDDGWESGVTAGRNAELKLPGAWTEFDAGYNTLEYAWTNGLEIYIWLKLKASRAGYTAGTIFKGVAIVQDLPLKGNADGAIEGEITLKINGVLTKVQPVPS